MSVRHAFHVVAVTGHAAWPAGAGRQRGLALHLLLFLFPVAQVNSYVRQRVARWLLSTEARPRGVVFLGAGYREVVVRGGPAAPSPTRAPAGGPAGSGHAFLPAESPETAVTLTASGRKCLCRPRPAGLPHASWCFPGRGLSPLLSRRPEETLRLVVAATHAQPRDFALSRPRARACLSRVYWSSYGAELLQWTGAVPSETHGGRWRHADGPVPRSLPLPSRVPELSVTSGWH